MIGMLSKPLNLDPMAPRRRMHHWDLYDSIDASEIFSMEPSFADGWLTSHPADGFVSHGYDVKPTTEEKGEGYVIRVETPGMKREDLKVELQGNRSVIVTGQTETLCPVNESIIEQERQTKKPRKKSESLFLWKRAEIPADADPTRIQLKYSDGILTVEVPRLHTAFDQLSFDTDDEKTEELKKEVEEKLAKVKELQAELESAASSAWAAQERLRAARKESSRNGKWEKVELTIGA
eukprot:CAMPEP_0181347390 /NCGR_PEP_ID=MMETSP1101-20121128/33853_1 /TAXON_ID=46948 /ORGANISM="Rhodomonas abbreviata, Strain Caron Lab Isolate" /LENGTH=235 /DNA_ID=CAMNT_0023459601 /DNA_START=71 /DNA_END=778 /DNA_ORIENTATION=-